MVKTVEFMKSKSPIRQQKDNHHASDDLKFFSLLRS